MKKQKNNKQAIVEKTGQAQRKATFLMFSRTKFIHKN